MSVSLAEIARCWTLPEPLQAQALPNGTNNRVQRVETPEGAYVLRISTNHTDLERLRFEHVVLLRMQEARLPFAVPVPLATTTGEYVASVTTPEGDALATLTPFLPGAYPDRGRLDQAEAAGEALGLLDLALAQLSPLLASEGVSWRSYGDLAHAHPLVPDPAAALAELPLPDMMRQRLVERYHWLMEQIPALYRTLPQQLVHEDYAPDNLLMEEARVTAVLDFEFCARDLRVMDPTVALSWWPGARFGSGAEWPIIAAFVRGYGRQARLTEAEVAAMPLLFELRSYTSLLHRLGRYRQGLEPFDAVSARVAATVERAEWLRTEGQRLVATVAAALGDAG